MLLKLKFKSLKLSSLGFYKNCKNSLFENNVEKWEELMLNKVYIAIELELEWFYLKLTFIKLFL